MKNLHDATVMICDLKGSQLALETLGKLRIYGRLAWQAWRIEMTGGEVQR